MEEIQGMDRVKIQRNRPSYKGEAGFYRSMAVGLAIFSFVELVIIISALVRMAGK